MIHAFIYVLSNNAQLQNQENLFAGKEDSIPKWPRKLQETVENYGYYQGSYLEMKTHDQAKVRLDFLFPLLRYMYMIPVNWINTFVPKSCIPSDSTEWTMANEISLP